MISGHRYITIPNNPSPVELVEISEPEYLNLLSDLRKVYEFMYYKRRIREIKMNIDAFFEAKRYYTEIYEKSYSKTIYFDYKEEAFVELNRCLINFISSFKSFVEHCESKIKKIFGDSSEQSKEFKTLLSELFDNNFSYRFLIKLRDYAVHIGYPIEYVSFVNYIFSPSNTDNWYEVQTLVSKDKLLSSGVFNARIKGEIELEKDPFDISLYIFKVYRLIWQVFRKTIQMATDEFIIPANRLIQLSQKYNQDNLCITMPKIELGRINFDSKNLPIQLAKEISEIV